MTYLEQNAATGRHIFPDLVRAFALMGIVLVNVAYFAWPGPETYFYGGIRSVADQIAAGSVEALFQFKSYSLFSIMFGAGLAYQMMSAERRGARFGPRYTRRLIGLFLLGWLHIAVAFSGDILIMYSLLGALLFFFRNLSVKALVRWAVGILVLQILITFLMAGAFFAMENFSPEEALAMNTELAASMQTSADTYGSGSFIEVAKFRLSEYLEVFMFIAGFQGPGALAFFLFGLAGVKSGVLENPDAPLWSRARRLYLPVGVVLSVIGAVLLQGSANTISGQGSLGTALIVLGAPFSTAGYLGLIAAWSKGAVKGLRLFLARSGTSSLTAYLLQSLILSLIFCGYGLGFHSSIGALGCIGIGFAVGAISLIFTSLWRTRFERGPMESVLRAWTYLGTGR